MGTKRILRVVVAALLAALVIAPAGVATAKLKKKRIPTTITFAFMSQGADGPYFEGSASYSGLVLAAGPSDCRAGRTVTIWRDGTLILRTQTQGNGAYSISASGPSAPGSYTASVGKRKIVRKKRHKQPRKFICLAATTVPVYIPQA